jgi:hypothetical protein
MFLLIFFELYKKRKNSGLPELFHRQMYIISLILKTTFIKIIKNELFMTA